MQKDRRHDPHLWTWEPPTAAIVVVTILLAVGVHVGRLVANLLVGAGATWPTGTGAPSGPDGLLVPSIATTSPPTSTPNTSAESWTSPVGSAFWRSLPRVVGGDASAGLSGSDTAHVAGAALTRTCVGIVELLVLVACLVLVRHAWHRWGPSRIRGTAPAADLPLLLGRARLARNAATLRPDLHDTDAPEAQDARSAGPRTPHGNDDGNSPVHRHGTRHGNKPRAGGRTARRYPHELGWRLGRAVDPHAGELWVPWDRTAGVIGPQGSGKTLDVLLPALLGAPGAALVTLTKPEDLLLSLTERASRARPCVVLDPFGLVDGVPAGLLGELVWDPVQGCVDSGVAERRAKAITAGNVAGATAGAGDDSARFYATEAAKVLQCYLHAAALAGRSIEDILAWVANPQAAVDPEEILRRHPMAEPFWHGLLRGSLRGDDRTAANTIATVQQAMSLFFRASIRARCIPSPARPATDLRALIAASGTVYLLGREDPYSSASPLMTAVAEHVLDTALAMAQTSPWGRLCPPFLACLDELPSTAPLPTLRTRMANERALGIAFVWAAQTKAQLTGLFGEHETRALMGLTNVLTVFGGSKDVAFNQELSDLLGTVRIARRSRSVGPGNRGGTLTGDDIAVLRPEEIRALPERRALVIAENAPPIIAGLHRVLDGSTGRQRLRDQRALRAYLHGQVGGQVGAPSPAKAAAGAALSRGATSGEDAHAAAGRRDHEAIAASARLGLTSEQD